MKINVNVQRKFKINNNEYSSVEEMPEDVRAVYEKALALRNGPEHATESTITKTKIVLNGKEYDGLEAMPPNVRQLYEEVVQTAKSGTTPSGIDLKMIGSIVTGESGDSGFAHSVGMRKPTTESSFSMRALVVTVALVAVILMVYFIISSR